MNPIEVKLKRASQFEESEKYLHALQIYFPLLDDNIYKRVACIKVSAIYEKLNNSKAAFTVFENYLNKYSDDEEIRVFYSHLLIRFNKFEEALDNLSYVTKEKNIDVYFLMGIAQFNLQEYDFARINFEQFVESNLNSGLLEESFIYLSKCNLFQNKLENALRSIDKAKAISVGNFEVYLLSAKIYYQKQMFTHAWKNIQRSLKISDESEIHQWAGKILIEMGEYNEAAGHLKISLATKENLSETYSLLGLTYLHSERLQEAKPMFEKALSLNPNDETANSGLQNCLANKSN